MFSSPPSAPHLRNMDEVTAQDQANGRLSNTICSSDIYQVPVSRRPHCKHRGSSGGQNTQRSICSTDPKWIISKMCTVVESDRQSCSWGPGSALVNVRISPNLVISDVTVTGERNKSDVCCGRVFTEGNTISTNQGCFVLFWDRESWFTSTALVIRTKEKCKQGKGVGQAGDGGWHFSV